MENFENNNEGETNNPQKLVQNTGEGVDIIEDGSGVRISTGTDGGLMELEQDFNLDSMSLEGGLSASSLILNSPSGIEESVVDKLPDPVTRPEVDGQPETSGVDVKRLSNSQRRRLKWYRRRGYPREEALKLALLQPDQSDKRDLLVANKRQRSAETASPNVSCKGPTKKRPRNRTSAAPLAPKPPSGATYREMVEALSVAITTADYPVSLLTTDQLKTVRAVLLDHIVDQETPDIRPKFRSCHFQNGYLTLACADQNTVKWLEKTALTLVPWEGAQLRAYDTKDLPKAHSFIGYFQDSVGTTDEKILRFLQNQNDGFSTHAWRIRRRNVLGKTVELLMEVDQKSASQIVEQRFVLNYMFGKARMRQVGRNPINTGATASAAKSRAVPAELPSGSAPPPPGQCNSAALRTECAELPSGSAPLPPKQCNPAKTRRAPRKPRKRRTQRPLVSSQPQRLNPPLSADRTSAACGMQQPKPAVEGISAALLSENAAGIRSPRLDPSLDQAKNGNPAAK